MSQENNISNISNDNENGETLILSKEEVFSRKFVLKNKTIGISISESDNLTELGYGIAHLRDAMIEVTRYILALGGKVAYGGDMRQGGFTELIFELLAYYKADNELLPNERFFSFLAWPLSLNLTTEKQAELRQNVSFVKVSPPEDLELANKNEFMKPDSSEGLYVWSMCLTKMREEMESVCNARIFIGGRTKGFKGKCPGILEELLIAINNSHPVYLIGAFGGITKDIIDALNNEQSNSFSNEYYFDNSEYKKMFDIYNGKHPDSKIDYPKYFSMLKNLSFKEVSKINGLSESENQRLAITPHISEVVYLILKGLTNSFSQ